MKEQQKKAKLFIAASLSSFIILSCLVFWYEFNYVFRDFKDIEVRYSIFQHPVALFMSQVYTLPKHVA
jgi:phosphoglycerol transferase MdoB-like AlkP superfamily enzyme